MTRHAQAFDRFLSLAVLALAVTTFVTGSAAQTKALGTIGGQVFGTTGFAAPGARVILQAADGKSPQTTVTNTQGRFWFPMLPPGLYDVRASAQGRSSEWRQNVGVRTGRQTTIALHLRSKKPTPTKTPASLREPIPREN